MKTLVAWDDPAEAELLDLYLNTDGSIAQLARTREEVLARAQAEDWDCLLLSLTFPARDQDSFSVFSEVQTALSDVPVVIGCRPTEVMRLPRFLTHGARSHVIRDSQKDFIFLVRACLESAVEAAHAIEASKLAQRLREEMESVRKLQESIIPRSRPSSMCSASDRWSWPAATITTSFAPTTAPWSCSSATPPATA